MEDRDELSPGSLVRRWRLGKQLRELREAAGKSQDDAAEYLGVKRPTISRIENGRHAILSRNVRFLCQLYEIGAPQVDTLVRQAEESNERGWWVSHSDTMPDWFQTWVGFESDAQEIRIYQSELVPGLLQVPSYVRDVRAAYLDKPDEAELENAVLFRRQRQKRLETNPPHLHVILNEAVVRRPVGDMKEQLARLIEVSAEPYMTLQVLNFEAGIHPGMTNPFTLLTLPEEESPNFVFLEHADGAVYLERPADLARYSNSFERMALLALSPEETRAFLTSLIGS
ncbi:helix-turn-helix transcriptional regulator [Actinokineospora auranticolor]|uniref:Transcriptional regulator with XRE-family HTH domain n=1 Tax=Actinokineospora auranticolor TaxID=155976 RepID=A0A2S6H052_9PSEU|nr:helix-turn-helix transcriptional regulator [Actinokineospora auranticolor]PPK70853.1 transcriptional regulator with XRE-family HTH domain [Actinokineospora auranticolor]